jgi:hypothetical protein
VQQHGCEQRARREQSLLILQRPKVFLVLKPTKLLVQITDRMARLWSALVAQVFTLNPRG